MGDWWQALGQALSEGFADLADPKPAMRVMVRLALAVFLGGVLGIERELTGKAAGLRTHMLVCLGAALLVLVPLQAGMSVDDLSRVIQGVVTGIGFIGGGVILKLSDQHRIMGLTTAAGIWLTAAVGIAVGMGRFGLALVSLVLALIVLTGVYRLEKWLEGEHPPTETPGSDSGPVK